MFKITIFSVFIVTLIPFSAFADAPQFSDFPVTEIYQGPNHPAISNKYFDNTFFERKNALKNQKVNYAGHYIVYTKQYDKNTISASIGDVKTGDFIMDFGQYYINDKNNFPFSVEHRANSKLLIVSGSKNNPRTYPTQTYWVINNDRPSQLGYYDFHKIEHNPADFKKYCQDLNAGKKFDGSSDFICTYPDKTINDIYNKLLNSSYDNHFLRYPLPKIGKTKGYSFKNDGDDASIIYDRPSHHCLKITINQLSVGKTIYTITQKQNKVTVQIHTNQ